ncbi:hypothetical protein, partial [Staphylococcus condimenti]|uniref:hypothetical protein n=1 Tax=Staphylococcus condimenti TaxID=70255 RepID=UPI001A91C109
IKPLTDSFRLSFVYTFLKLEFYITMKVAKRFKDRNSKTLGRLIKKFKINFKSFILNFMCKSHVLKNDIMCT